MENPFQVSGPRGAYEVKKLEEGLFVRMEMPGIEKEDLKLRVEYGNVFVSGEGRRESEHEDSGRSYSANIELSSSSFEPRNITAELKNGVLRMLIPLAKNFESASGSSEIKCSWFVTDYPNKETRVRVALTRTILGSNTGMFRCYKILHFISDCFKT